MENIGSQLKERREKLSKSLTELHEQTRINVEHLEFLESDNFTFLPETYVKSYLKNYAKALELDEDEILNSYLEIQATKKQEQEKESIENGLGIAPSPRNIRILEWALGIGALVLTMSIILVYIQYRSNIYAKPTDQIVLLPKINALPTDIVIGDQLRKEHSDSIIELQIKTNDTVWIHFTDAGQNVTKYVLSPEQNLIFVADDQFNISVGNSKKIRFSLDGKEISSAIATGENINLTFIKSAVVNKENRKPH